MKEYVEDPSLFIALNKS